MSVSREGPSTAGGHHRGTQSLITTPRTDPAKTFRIDISHVTTFNIKSSVDNRPVNAEPDYSGMNALMGRATQILAQKVNKRPELASLTAMYDNDLNPLNNTVL
jgi:hypothetical protein